MPIFIEQPAQTRTARPGASRKPESELAILQRENEADIGERQREILARKDLWTAADIADRRGLPAETASQNAYNLRDRAKKIFGVRDPARKGYVHPQSQFRGLEPRPVIARILELVPKESREWPLALWYFAPHPRLDDHTPDDWVRSNGEPELLLEAARLDFTPDIPRGLPRSKAV